MLKIYKNYEGPFYYYCCYYYMDMLITITRSIILFLYTQSSWFLNKMKNNNNKKKNYYYVFFFYLAFGVLNLFLIIKEIMKCQFFFYMSRTKHRLEFPLIPDSMKFHFSFGFYWTKKSSYFFFFFAVSCQFCNLIGFNKGRPSFLYQEHFFHHLLLIHLSFFFFSLYIPFFPFGVFFCHRI